MASDSGSHLPILDEVGAELHRVFVAEQQRRGHLGRSRRFVSARPSVRLAGVAAVVLVLFAAVAVAASGVLSGSPVKGFVWPRNVGQGAAIKSSAKLLPLSVPDPAGGLPWGLREVKTTRGDACLQYGRVDQGKLGVLGQDGAFNDDHKFHALPSSIVPFGERCTPPDAHGNLFTANAIQGVPASAYVAGCVRPFEEPLARGPRLCPVKDERALFFGALGPDATSITYTLNGHSVTQRTVRPDGAYLIVTDAVRGAAPSLTGPGTLNDIGYLPSGSTQPIRTITYRDGTTCRIERKSDINNHGQPCTPTGFTALNGSSPSAAALRRPLTLKVLLHKHYPHLGPEAVLSVTFTAPIAVNSDASSYSYWLELPKCGSNAAGQQSPGGTTGGRTNTNIVAGQRITVDMQLANGPPGTQPCPGTYIGRVWYDPPRSPRAVERQTHTLANTVVVGKFSIHIN